MMFPKFTSSNLRKNIYYILFDVGSWILFYHLLKNAKNWVNIENSIKNDYSIIQHRKLGFIYYSNLSYRRTAISEWEFWDKQYNFPFCLHGKTILDIGAGCGETALFFASKGADKVICIEKNKMLQPFLIKNKCINKLNMDIIIDSFNVKHLDLCFDAVKMDIDGGEIELLKFGEIDFPMIIEVHSRNMAYAFQKKGFETILKLRSIDQYIVIMNNFKKLI